MICFVHIPRTGGSSIHASFLPVVGEERWRVYDHPGSLPLMAEQIRSTNDRNWYVGGHFAISEIDEAVGLKSQDFLFSVVRDPVDRVSSLHRLLMRSPEWLPQVKEAIGKDMDFFYKSCIDNNVFDTNAQCRFISGAEDYESASAALSRYDCIGSMSDFPGFIEILGREVYKKTGFKFDYLDTNHNAAEATGFDVSPALRSKIEQDFAEDFKLVAEVERRQAALLQNLRG